MLTWLQLLRLPTVFTAIADILCGFLVAATLNAPRFVEWTSFPWLILASIGLYLGGMVLNDVFDSELDAKERPERPIPSGRVSRRTASAAGYGLLLAGLLSGLLAWHAADDKGQSTLIAGAIALAVLAYNGYLKKTWAGPLGMALCRFLNMALGASTTVNSVHAVLSWQQPLLGAAIGLGIYIVGVTWFARYEAGDEAEAGSGLGLDGGLAISAVGIIVIALSTIFAQLHGLTAACGLFQYLVIFGVTVVRGVAAIKDGTPVVLQRTVGKFLLWIIVIDAVIVYTVTGSFVLEAVVLSLILPTVLLRRFIPMS